MSEPKDMIDPVLEKICPEISLLRIAMNQGFDAVYTIEGRLENLSTAFLASEQAYSRYGVVKS